MAFFKDAFYGKHFALLFAINSIFIALAQFANLPKRFDFHWWHCLIFRESMLLGTYFLAFCLVYYLPLPRGNVAQIIKKSFVALVVIMSAILLLVNLFLVLNFGGTLNEHLLGIALQSDPNEVREFFGEYFSVRFCAFCVAIFAMLWGIYYFVGKIYAGGGICNYCKSKKRNSSDLKPQKRVKIIWIFFSFIIIALVLVHCFRLRPYNERESDVVYVAFTSAKSALTSILSAMRKYEQIEANFDAYIKNIAHTKAQNKPNIILVIGESAQRNLMQIYGYALPNTPILSAIHAQNAKNKGNLFVFSDVISSQIGTFDSLAQVLTFANQDNLKKQWFEYLNIIDAMKLGGYKSVVVSNQERFSLWSKATTTIFSRADELHWSADSVAGKRLDTMGFDGAILPIVDRVVETMAQDLGESKGLSQEYKNDSRGSILDEKLGLRSHEQGNRTDEFIDEASGKLPDLSPKDNAPHSALFLTLHLMGSHVGYANRYPKSFERFSPSDITHAQNPRAKADLAEYANSILYTDFVLGEIIARFADKDSIVIYISDHGNDVWDTGKGSVRSDTKITRFMVEVPFVVFVSDTFKAKRPQVYSRIARATTKPFMLDDLMHAIIDIAGFKIDGYESARSVFSDDFNAKRARKVGTKASVDYDRELKELK